jgi:hypothetical protein
MAWVIGEVSAFAPQKDTQIKLWSLAQARRDEAETIEHWQAWVRGCCEGLRQNGVNNPIGLLTHRLTESSPSDQPVKREKPRRAISNQSESEAAEYKARAVRARTERPEPLPSSVAVTRLAKRCGGYVNALSLVTEEWERQGRPYPEDFDPSPLERIQ